MKKELNLLITTYRSLQPFEGECIKKLNEKFRLEFNFNSNHLEGNTLTYGETKLLLLFDQTLGNHEMRELEEMKAHDIASLKIKEEAADKERPLTEQFIKELNELILVRPYWKDAQTADGQKTRRLLKVGTYKEHPNHVQLTNGEIFEYATPQETPILMAELVKWYNTEAAKKEFTAIELAAILHYRYIRIHPFDDGNGRVARLMVNYVLYRADLPPVIIKSAEKRDYLRALQQADAGDLQAFIDYMTRQLAWSLDLSIRAARGENIEEQDDWEKKLSLIKKGLGEKIQKTGRVTDVSVRTIFENVIRPVFDLYENKISQFDALFTKNKKTLLWKNNSTWKVFLNEGIEIGRAREFKIVSIFEKYLELNKNIISCEIDFLFDVDAYIVRIENKIIFTKPYNDYLTEDEMNEIVSTVAKDIMRKIEEIQKK